MEPDALAWKRKGFKEQIEHLNEKGRSLRSADMSFHKGIPGACGDFTDDPVHLAMYGHVAPSIKVSQPRHSPDRFPRIPLRRFPPRGPPAGSLITSPGSVRSSRGNHTYAAAMIVRKMKMVETRKSSFTSIPYSPLSREATASLNRKKGSHTEPQRSLPSTRGKTVPSLFSIPGSPDRS